MKIFSIILALLISPILFRFDIFQTKTDDVVLLGLNGGQKIGQTFTANHNNIYHIKLLVNNPNLSYKLPILFSIKSSPSDVNNIIQLKFSGDNIGTDYWLPLKFTPIPNSKNKTYYMELSAFPSSSSAIEVRRSKNNTYDFGSAYLDGRKTNGDLGFKVYYKVGIKQFVGDSLSDFMKRIGADKEFFVVYMVIIVVLILTLLYAFIIK